MTLRAPGRSWDTSRRSAAREPSQPMPAAQPASNPSRKKRGGMGSARAKPTRSKPTSVASWRRWVVGSGLTRPTYPNPTAMFPGTEVPLLRGLLRDPLHVLAAHPVVGHPRQDEEQIREPGEVGHRLGGRLALVQGGDHPPLRAPAH